VTDSILSDVVTSVARHLAYRECATKPSEQK